MKDLVILVADKSMELTLKGALPRSEALQIRKIEFEVRTHLNRDGGVRTNGPQMLALEHRRFRHALLMLDYEGSGTDKPTALALEAELDERLRINWKENGKAIVIEPELDVWMWGSDHAVEQAIGWEAGVGLREWLRQKNFTFQQNGKPIRPKEALEMAMQEARKPRSSALYEHIASKISLSKCTDDAFKRLREQLVQWFPKNG